MICISMMMIFLTTISNVSGQGGVPTWMRPPGEQSKMFGSTLGNPLGGRGSAILSTKGSDVMSPVPLPSTLFGLHATDVQELYDKVKILEQEIQLLKNK